MGKNPTAQEADAAGFTPFQEPYEKEWARFCVFHNYRKEKKGPSERRGFYSLFQRHEQARPAARSVRTAYSRLNSVVKRNYNKQLQDHPRLKVPLKSTLPKSK
eukprot:TRINITY_DN817_c1_g1_i3.p1 TRINITY_DN817_c1_g1~~TRINITY_DN817_c1_g1_i3.p1  ORF type:complete len:103 (+),score=3.87 TRINITY_DN817_c1_g1_i3:118-426(+)